MGPTEKVSEIADGMRITETGVTPPLSVHRTHFPAFPFKPYGIQKDFMGAIYKTLDLNGIGIFESPTGTGKTLSLICSSLQWLQDQQLKVEEEKAKQDALDDKSTEPDWMKDFGTKKDEINKKQKDERKEKRRARLAKEAARLKAETQKAAGCGTKSEMEGSIGDSDDAFVLDEWESDTEKAPGSARKRKKGVTVDSSDESESDEETETKTKVYFCSRTHSQLSQFIGELKRTSFTQSELQTTSIASRKNLCINEAVLRLGSTTRINERCLELQKDKAKSSSAKLAQTALGGKSKASKGGCPYLAQPKLQRSFKDHVLEFEPLDIEDLARLGRRIGTCPYYGARKVLPTADLVALPYQSILHKPTRESLGISLKDSVVIVDEAHNLVDAVTAIHSSLITGQQLVTVHGQLLGYLTRFADRLAPGNRRYIQTLLTLTAAFLRRLRLAKDGTLITSSSTSAATSPAASATGEVSTLNDFLFSLAIDNVNLFRLERYVRESNAVHKISGYGERQLQQDPLETTEAASAHSSAIGSFQAAAAFIVALTSTDSDGRVIVTSARSGGQPHEATLKFVMLNAAKHFQPIVNDARAIVLAGGTLQPTSELRERLFPQVPDVRLRFFSCGHIVPRESVLPIALRQGPTGRLFDFRFESRGAPAMIEELGRLLSNLCTVVPGGLVCFFPSFAYADHVAKSWEAAGILASIRAKKAVFTEPRTAAEVESTLDRYRACIVGSAGMSSAFSAGTGSGGSGKLGKKGGAVLLSVVGGKMSEGINFSDDMGRCVVMVGLPYPSKTDPELQERMQYLERGLDLTQLGLSPSADGLGPETPGGERVGAAVTVRKGRGHEYYENLCMKAVNQSIGRAIRHAGDYASIILVDHRYAPAAGTQPVSGPAKKLPGWIQDSLVTAGTFGEAYKKLHQFFKARELQA
ncbi:Helicase [Klebsormidium nitens]|uniref:Helicase n=1 Tax=Klebsormidium nitens TaxID=105231 RepID=A0A1Y1II53_KLENI|nr:Helicase [Klebsormidium nitens]|eukprot:GAQ88396.1 Helicase [Klebsormidium nitens]